MKTKRISAEIHLHRMLADIWCGFRKRNRRVLSACMLLLLSGVFTLVKAQTVNYSYDASGNVVSKKVVQPAGSSLSIQTDTSLQTSADSFLNDQVGTVDTDPNFTSRIKEESEPDRGDENGTPVNGASTGEPIALYLSDDTACSWKIAHRNTHTTHH